MKIKVVKKKKKKELKKHRYRRCGAVFDVFQVAVPAVTPASYWTPTTMCSTRLAEYDHSRFVCDLVGMSISWRRHCRISRRRRSRSRRRSRRIVTRMFLLNCHPLMSCMTDVTNSTYHSQASKRKSAWTISYCTPIYLSLVVMHGRTGEHQISVFNAVIKLNL